MVSARGQPDPPAWNDSVVRTIFRSKQSSKPRSGRAHNKHHKNNARRSSLQQKKSTHHDSVGAPPTRVPKMEPLAPPPILVCNLTSTLPLYDTGDWGQELWAKYGHDTHLRHIQDRRQPPRAYIPPEIWWRTTAHTICHRAYENGRGFQFSHLRDIAENSLQGEPDSFMGFPILECLPTNLPGEHARALLYARLNPPSSGGTRENARVFFSKILSREDLELKFESFKIKCKCKEKTTGIFHNYTQKPLPSFAEYLISIMPPSTDDNTKLPDSTQTLLKEKYGANFFYRENVQSAFTTTEGTVPPIFEQITSSAFASFVKLSKIVGPTVEINPGIFGSDLYSAFSEEGIKCSQSDSYDVQIVFHGTSEANIESILRNGLDPTLRLGQRFGQGEYFASTPAMPLAYCRGGKKMLIFAVITTKTDIRGGVIVVKKPQRQLPIATLSFDSYSHSALEVANDFHQQVLTLWDEMKNKEKRAKEARDKEKILRLILEGEYLAASDMYNLVRGDGSPPESFAEEVAVYVRDHIRDDEMVDIYFPNLPPRPIKASEVFSLNSEKCKAEAEDAKRKYETISKLNP